MVLSYGVILVLSNLAGLGLWGDFLMRGVLCLLVPNGLMLLVNRKTEAFRYLYEKVLARISQRRFE